MECDLRERTDTSPRASVDRTVLPGRVSEQTRFFRLRAREEGRVMECDLRERTDTSQWVQRRRGRGARWHG
jgi:hypothetical protein